MDSNLADAAGVRALADTPGSKRFERLRRRPELATAVGENEWA
jgi:hypothetical protein